MLNKSFLSILLPISIANVLGQVSSTINCLNGTATIIDDTTGQYRFLDGPYNVTCEGQCFLDFSSKTPTVNDKITFGCTTDCDVLTETSVCCNENDYCNNFNPPE